jgi:hypothetical protein
MGTFTDRWTAQEICKRRLWKQATLSIGAPMRNLEGWFIYWRFGDTVIIGFHFLDLKNI